MHHFDFDSLDYFGLKFARLGPTRNLPTIALFQVFRRSLADGVVQGLSIGQIGKRHLLYVGTDGGALRLCIGFVWLTRAA